MNVSSDVALRDVETTADAVQDIAKEYFIERKSRATSGLQIVVRLFIGSKGIMKYCWRNKIGKLTLLGAFIGLDQS